MKKCIWKHIVEVFDEYCACREPIIEFKGRYHDFHGRYYEEVIFQRSFSKGFVRHVMKRCHNIE